MTTRARPLLAAVTALALLAALALAPACTSGVTTVDWVDFIQFDEIRYFRASPPVAIDDSYLGTQFAQVKFNVSDNVTDPYYRSEDGDAAFLDVGTPVYEVRGYSPNFRLAASFDGQLILYEADSNPSATVGADLLDIEGKVTSIAINSETDGTTELAAIDDPDQVAALVALVLAAPVDQRPRDHDGPRYFVAFQLIDGTRVANAYWLDSGELHRGIMLSPEFASAVQHALALR